MGQIVISIKIDPELLEEIEYVARSLGMNRSAFIKTAIIEKLMQYYRKREKNIKHIEAKIKELKIEV